MQTELRVIDLGRGRGKVVRRFPVRGRVVSPSSWQPALRAYYWRLISRPEAIQRLVDSGFREGDACYLIELVDWLYLLRGKEARNDRNC